MLSLSLDTLDAQQKYIWRYMWITFLSLLIGLSLLPYVSPCCHLLIPTLFLFYVLFLVLRDFQKDFLITLCWFPECSSVLWEIVCRVIMVPDITVPGITHELLRIWINTCSVKTEKTNHEKIPLGIFSSVFYVLHGPLLFSKKFCIKQPISLQNFILTC